jgi:hypothetical protein
MFPDSGYQLALFPYRADGVKSLQIGDARRHYIRGKS